MFEKSPVAFLDELAQGVGGTKRWWADQARAGKIPARKVAGHWCLTPDDLAVALENFRSMAVQRARLLTTTSAWLRPPAVGHRNDLGLAETHPS